MCTPPFTFLSISYRRLAVLKTPYDVHEMIMLLFRYIKKSPTFQLKRRSGALYFILILCMIEGEGLYNYIAI